MKPIDIEVIYDFICPWCWIGHEQLKQALTEAALPEAPTIRYTPYELNPTLPKPGVDRKAYRTAKFGSWARSQAMDEEVAAAGRRAGVEFSYAKVHTTPNTRLAHRLMWWAQQGSDRRVIDALFEAMFAAYFSRGENLGELEVLVRLAESSGLDPDKVRAFLGSDEGERDVLAAELATQREGVRAVPTIRIGRLSVSGAQPAATLADMLREAASGQEADIASSRPEKR